MGRVIVFLLALFFFTPGTVNSESAGRGRMGSGMMYDEPVFYSAVLAANAGLTLSAEQGVRIRALDEKYTREIKAIQAELHSKSEEMKSEWLGERPDRGKIADLQDEVMNLRDRMRNKMTDHHREVINLLTPGQRTQVRDISPGRGYNKQAGCDRSEKGK